MKSILVTRRVPSEFISRLREHFVVHTNEEDVLLSGPSLVERALGCIGVLANLTEKFDASIFEALPQLRIVANMAVGTNNIDLAAAKGLFLFCFI
jgi:lactate dehydrogenase-like 2-hydroxyacid dehydrogenase